MKFDEFFQRVSRVTEIQTQKDLAALLGVDPSAITLAKRRGVPKGWALAVASLFGLNPIWLKTGTGPIRRGGGEDAAVFIPVVSARACAGAGSLEVRDNIVGELPFERSWITRKGSPENMVAMEVVGDSMSPELEPGDTVLVDQTQTRVLENSLYVVGLGEGLQVKRIQARPGLVTLFGTNQKYAPVTLQGDEVDTLRIIGRVLWSSRSYA